MCRAKGPVLQFLTTHPPKTLGKVHLEVVVQRSAKGCKTAEHPAWTTWSFSSSPQVYSSGITSLTREACWRCCALQNRVAPLLGPDRPHTVCRYQFRTRQSTRSGPGRALPRKNFGAHTPCAHSSPLPLSIPQQAAGQKYAGPKSWQRRGIVAARRGTHLGKHRCLATLMYSAAAHRAPHAVNLALLRQVVAQLTGGSWQAGQGTCCRATHRSCGAGCPPH